MKKILFARWRASFLTGLAVVLPGVITLAVVKWLFGTVSSFTDVLLFFLPDYQSRTRMTAPARCSGTGVCWPCAWRSLIVITLIGVLARYYFGKRLIDWADNLMLRVPVLNKIYGTIKQVDEAFTSGKKSSFKTVVMVEYPREGIYSVGFITSEQADEVYEKTDKKCVCIFIPTTPIPTGGFLIIVPEEKVIKLDMCVADGFKYIISVGAISQERRSQRIADKEVGQTMLLHMTESATGIILRTRPLTETSLIVHWLTPNFGRIATVAKGARRPKSPFAGKLDLFYVADFSFSRSRQFGFARVAGSEFARNARRDPGGHLEIAAGGLRGDFHRASDGNGNAATRAFLN